MKTIFLLAFTFINSIVFSQSLITYTPSTAEITNPGRGFYSHRETFANSSGNMISPLTVNDIYTQRTSKNITLIFRIYYLSQFKSSPISTSFLNAIQNDFNVIRNANAKIIVRFAYNNFNQTHLHNDDASKFWVLNHIAQLKNILQQNSDIMLCFQAGFIGTWGEWGYTHPDFTTTTVWIPNYPNRKEVVDSLLKILPKDKMIQLRTPLHKYSSGMFGNDLNGTSAALPFLKAFTGNDTARIGHHNDAFLSSFNDSYTYKELDTLNDKKYLEEESKYVIVGGESINDNSTYSNCINALTELKRFHYTYFNYDYFPAFIARWNNEGCLQTIKKKLGYRLELINANYTDSPRQGYTFNINLNIQNVGYAPPYDKKLIQFILKNTSTNAYYALTIPTIDNRFWLPDSVYNINISAGIGTLPQGTYNLYLALKDSNLSLSNNPFYSIQLANTGVWDATTGYNLLKANITINNSNNTGTAIYTGSLWFGTPSPLSTNVLSFSATKQSNKTVLLNWVVAENYTAKSFIVERANNPSNFISIANIEKANTNSFSFIDTKPNEEINYYRLVIVDKDGSKTYSNVQTVNFKSQLSDINIYPNPSKNTVNISSQENIQEIKLINQLGQKLQLFNNLNSKNQTLNIEKIPKGIYIVQITHSNGEIKTHKIVIN